MAARHSLPQEVREKKETHKSRARFWEVAGSKMGQITGGWLLMWLGVVGGWLLMRLAVVASCRIGPLAVGSRWAMRPLM